MVKDLGWCKVEMKDGLVLVRLNSSCLSLELKRLEGFIAALREVAASQGEKREGPAEGPASYCGHIGPGDRFCFQPTGHAGAHHGAGYGPGACHVLTGPNEKDGAK